MEFEFNNQLMPQSFVEINNLGSFAIEAFNATGAYYYYLVQTIFGQSIIASCGPVVPDIDRIPPGFSIRIDKIAFNEQRIIKGLTLFLNDKYKELVDASEISIEDAINQFRDAREYLRNLDAETF